MHRRAVLVTLGFLTAGLLGAAPAPPDDNPPLMLVSRSTAECVGVPDATPLDRGVPGLAVVRARQIPVPSSREVVSACLEAAADDPDNPVHQLVAEYGPLLGLHPEPPGPGFPQLELPRPELIVFRGEGRRGVTATRPAPPGPAATRTAPEPRAVALVDTTVSDLCAGIPITNAPEGLALLDTRVADVLRARSNRQCAVSSADYRGRQPLSQAVEKLPPLPPGIDPAALTEPPAPPRGEGDTGLRPVRK
ncbi:hypothetical protein GCM10018785_17610 [Streptomyces longispororuber]|uniref:Secreted protein n=1 Tax=Streptomyces longispororuber TaxID=68230 RepID=A0A918ZEN5_9ACTN|nr:hypothetical protein [Streptomyces longispororuber]GHE48505.1 hypothetical protein GCM10018785_17610 [Streptomyces longispororuber]